MFANQIAPVSILEIPEILAQRTKIAVGEQHPAHVVHIEIAGFAVIVVVNVIEENLPRAFFAFSRRANIPVDILRGDRF